MSNPGWKKFERRVAAALGGRRVRAGERELEDVEHPLLSVECKLIRIMPVCMEEPMVQAERNAPAGKTPVVVVKQKGRPDNNALVLLRFRSFRHLAGS